MSYEYAPRGLQVFVKEIVENPPKLVLRHQGSKGYKRYTNEIRPVFERYIQANDLDGFDKWTQMLRSRQMLTLATLFTLSLDERWKRALISSLEGAITKDRRMFRIFLDVLYDTCGIPHLWSQIQHSYRCHTERIQRRIPTELRDSWEDYLSVNDPVSFLADAVGNSSFRHFVDVMGDFYIHTYHTFFHEVLFKVFASAKAPFYNRESPLYRDVFETAPTSERQSMVASLIRNCALDDVGGLGQFIHNHMGTYTKKPSLWHLVPDAERRKFASWIMRRELKNFFQGVDQNHERYLYWHKFAPFLEDVVIIDHKHTMVMFFRDVVIMEVLKTGAVYVYSRKVFDEHFGIKIASLFARRERYLDADLSREDVRERAFVLNGTGWLPHRGQWQYDFDSWLRMNLRWEVDARVLAVKENQGD